MDDSKLNTFTVYDLVHSDVCTHLCGHAVARLTFRKSECRNRPLNICTHAHPYVLDGRKDGPKQHALLGKLYIEHATLKVYWFVSIIIITFSVTIVLGLQKSCKDSAESSCVPCW